MINQFICGNDGPALEVTTQSTSGYTNPAQWLVDWSSGGRSDAGVAVNGYTALTHCPLWQGVNVIAGDIGCVPIRVVRNEFDDQRSHAAWNLLRLRPNALQSPSVWKETMIQWALIWGNGVSLIRRQGSRPVELIPLRPDALWPELIDWEGLQIMVYHYHSPSNGQEYRFLPDDVVHIQGLTGDGIWGYPLWQVGKNTIGHGLALQRHGNSTFANGAVPSGVLQAPEGANGISKNPEARKNLRDEWNAVHRGPNRAGEIAILWEGIEYKQTSSTNIDAQWVDALRFDRYQAASLLNLPPHKLGAMEDSSVRSNLEEQNADYIQRTLTRWFNRCTEEFKRKLLTVSEWKSDEYDFIWDVGTFLKADIDTLTTVIDRLVKATVINPNEGRRMLGKPPREGGEVYGSPAINPNDSSTDDTEIDPEPAKKPTQKPKNPSQSAKSVHRDLLVDRVGNVLQRESHNLRRAADAKLLKQDGTARNFVEWIDGFYEGNGSTSTLLGMVDSIAGKSIEAAKSVGISTDNLKPAINAWAIERRRCILDACSRVTQSELITAVDEFNNLDIADLSATLVDSAIGTGD